MSRNQLLLGLASVLIAAAIVVIAIDVDEESSTLVPDAPAPPPEELVARLMRTFVSRVIEEELRPRVAELEGTQIVDGSGGTATVRRVIDGDRVEMRIMFHGYVLRLDPEVTVENEIQADGTVTYTRGDSEVALRVSGTDVRLGVFDAERRDPRTDVAGRFTFDLSGRDVAGLSGEVARNGDQRLEIKPATPAP